MSKENIVMLWSGLSCAVKFFILLSLGSGILLFAIKLLLLLSILLTVIATIGILITEATEDIFTYVLALGFPISILLGYFLISVYESEK